MSGRRPAPSTGAQIQSAKREAPAKGGGALKVVLGLLALVVVVGGVGAGVVLSGVVDLGGGGGGGTDPVTDDGGATAGDAGSAMQAGGTVQVAEPSADRGTAKLSLQPPGQAVVDIRATVGDFSIEWDGTGSLELVGLEPGTYKTKVKPTEGGSAARATLDVEAGKTCTFVFDVRQAEEWQSTGCE